MTDVLDKLIDTLQSLDKGAIINAVVKENEKEILDLNRTDQLFNKGINSEGSPVLPDYAPSTIVKKMKEGLPTHVTLFEKGDWHKSFIIHYGIDFIEITAPPAMVKGWDLTAGLIKRYSEFIFSLTKENLSKVQDLINPRIVQKIREQILLS
jgi:hypothetical protein